MAKIKDPNRWGWLTTMLGYIVVWGGAFSIVGGIVFFLWNNILIKTGLMIVPLNPVEAFLLGTLIVCLHQLWMHR